MSYLGNFGALFVMGMLVGSTPTLDPCLYAAKGILAYNQAFDLTFADYSTPKTPEEQDASDYQFSSRVEALVEMQDRVQELAERCVE